MQSAAMHFAPSIFDSFPSEDSCVVMADEKWPNFLSSHFLVEKVQFSRLQQGSKPPGKNSTKNEGDAVIFFNVGRKPEQCLYAV